MVPFLVDLNILDERVADDDSYPFVIPAVRSLSLHFWSPICLFVGENGSGKSTVVEAIADLCRLPTSGGGRVDLNHRFGPESTSRLADALRPSFRRRPRDGYFFRAEFQAEFASLLDQRRDDPWFKDDPYELYGGKSLHERSHGEAFLAVILNRFKSGLYLMDEPESALSPTRMLTLMTAIDKLARSGRCQFIIAIHSPLLMTVPNVQIVSFDQSPPQDVRLEETIHYQLTRSILLDHETYWRSVRAKENT